MKPETVLFLTAVGISRNCCSEVYNGARVLSESEAQAVTDFVKARSSDILCFLTIHSYGQLILVPFGHPNITAPNYDELVSLTPEKDRKDRDKSDSEKGREDRKD